MKKVNKKRKTLSTGILLLLILLFSAIVLCFGISIGFLIDACLNKSIEDIIITVFFNLIIGSIYFVLLNILIRTKDIENNKTRKWYFNGNLLSLVLTLPITALTVITLQPTDGFINSLVGFGMFPLIGIITTPNIVKYARKDTEKWKKIFYKKGNLDSSKETDDYYRVKTPVSFEKKILFEVYKHQFLNILVVIVFMAFVIYLCVHHIMTDQSYTDNVVTNIIQTRANRKFGFILFLTIIFLSFGIPIVAYYITNALKKIRVVRNHEYIAYHVIVPRINNGKIYIFDKNRRYAYNYCTCVGIKEKNIHNIPATLIFVPDDVLIFPDNEKYKVEKYKKTK